MIPRPQRYCDDLIEEVSALKILLTRQTSQKPLTGADIHSIRRGTDKTRQALVDLQYANPPPGSVKAQQTGEPFPEQIATASKNLSAAIEARAAEEQVKEAEKTLSELKLTYDLWRRQNRYRFLFDLLSEPDDKGRHLIAFPRFQIVVWTLVLGVIFVSDVLTKLAMPAFDSNLLVFMSISSGTYLGFKLPPAKKQ